MSEVKNQPRETIMKQNKQAPEAAREGRQPSGEKKPYRKPALRRLGKLKSVAGSGVDFGNVHGKKG
jgi:hypothetical protein